MATKDKTVKPFAERDHGWTIDKRTPTEFEAGRFIDATGLPGGGPGERQDLEAEIETHEGQQRIAFFTRSGDAHGDDYQSTSFDLDFETARAFVAWLTPILFGSGVPVISADTIYRVLEEHLDAQLSSWSERDRGETSPSYPLLSSKDSEKVLRDVAEKIAGTLRGES